MLTSNWPPRLSPSASAATAAAGTVYTTVLQSPALYSAYPSSWTLAAGSVQPSAAVMQHAPGSMSAPASVPAAAVLPLTPSRSPPAASSGASTAALSPALVPLSSSKERRISSGLVGLDDHYDSEEEYTEHPQRYTQQQQLASRPPSFRFYTPLAKASLDLSHVTSSPSHSVAAASGSLVNPSLRPSRAGATAAVEADDDGDEDIPPAIRLCNVPAAVTYTALQRLLRRWQAVKIYPASADVLALTQSIEASTQQLQRFATSSSSSTLQSSTGAAVQLSSMFTRVTAVKEDDNMDLQDDSTDRARDVIDGRGHNSSSELKLDAVTPAEVLSRVWASSAELDWIVQFRTVQDAERAMDLQGQSMPVEWSRVHDMLRLFCTAAVEVARGRQQVDLIGSELEPKSWSSDLILSPMPALAPVVSSGDDVSELTPHGGRLSPRLSSVDEALSAATQDRQAPVSSAATGTVSTVSSAPAADGLALSRWRVQLLATPRAQRMWWSRASHRYECPVSRSAQQALSLFARLLNSMAACLQQRSVQVRCYSSGMPAR